MINYDFIKEWAILSDVQILVKVQLSVPND